MASSFSASREPSRCPVSCRARRGIRPVVRSASLPLLPNGWAAAAGAGPAPRVAGRCADTAWRDVAPAARPQSAVMRGGEAWAWRAPLVIRDCHVSRADRRADLVGFVFGFWACSLCGAGTAVLMHTAEAVLHHLISGRSSLAPVPKCLIHEAEARWGWALSESAAGVAGHG